MENNFLTFLNAKEFFDIWGEVCAEHEYCDDCVFEMLCSSQSRYTMSDEDVERMITLAECYLSNKIQRETNNEQ